MHDLAPQTALGGAVPELTEIGTLCIRENPDIALASVAARQGQEKACAQAMRTFIGIDPPGPGEALMNAPFSVIWMTSAQFLVTAPFATHELIADELSDHLGASASVTEQSDAWACFDVSGAPLADMFERLCPAPVRRMATGSAQRTTIHHLGCFLICLSTDQMIRVLGPRSAAASLHHALLQAARSVS